MQSNPSSKVLAFKTKPTPSSVHESSLRVLYTQNREAGLQPKKYSRHIPQAPERILDAPELLDDYYLNLLDWSPNNVLGVALGNAIYLWNAADGSIQQLMETQGEGSHVTSLAWIQEGNYMAVGTSDHKVQLWDVAKLKQASRPACAAPRRHHPVRRRRACLHPPTAFTFLNSTMDARAARPL